VVIDMDKQSVKLIKWYQKNLSGNKHFVCRHKPSCSNYALGCYERFSFPKATFLTAKRVLTCNPLFKPKYDPVPEKKVKPKKPKSNL
jgi:hypothetical protein